MNCRSNANIVDLGGGPRNDKLEHPVSYYFLNGDSQAFGLKEEVPGHLLVVSNKFPDALSKHGFREFSGWTGPGVLAAVMKPVEFPVLVEPKDDLPPATLITRLRRDGDKLHLEGVAHDDGTVASVSINGTAAKITAQHAGVADWECTIASAANITARARDASGNEERWVHSSPVTP